MSSSDSCDSPRRPEMPEIPDIPLVDDIKDENLQDLIVNQPINEVNINIVCDLTC